MSEQAPSGEIVLEEMIVTPGNARGVAVFLVGAGVIGGVVWALTRKSKR